MSLFQSHLVITCAVCQVQHLYGLEVESKAGCLVLNKTLPLEVEISCQLVSYGSHVQNCPHNTFDSQVAKAMDSRLKDGHFILYLGTYRGTPDGNLASMYSAIENDDMGLAPLFHEHEDPWEQGTNLEEAPPPLLPQLDTAQSYPQKLAVCYAQLGSIYQGSVKDIMEHGNPTDSRYESFFV